MKLHSTLYVSREYLGNEKDNPRVDRGASCNCDCCHLMGILKVTWLHLRVNVRVSTATSVCVLLLVLLD